ncbi:pyrimidine deoxynucleoside triphosphate (dYTP) pyrophosphohydrolase YfoO [Klebsiella pneumoniae subsp. rhinoscleromatis]|nr:pyrimidine deoxynucleoside triphosphate (dYTP) pyrophosphohydrolase YfoO [Klebsiella pneumoniae subsp. rhinoscleromatis]
MKAIICFAKWPPTAGFFPGQWALSGGGVEPGERIEEALRREIREELGEKLILTNIAPWCFRDDTRVKTYPDGHQETIYMIYLIFDWRERQSRCDDQRGV